MLNLLLHGLAFMAALSIAIWIGKWLLHRTDVVIESDWLRFLLCLGVPLFALTTCFSWLFPSQISFAEHTCDNLALALIASLTWRTAHGSPVDRSPSRK